MLSRKLILSFLLWFVVIYGVLIFPWPGWNDLYSQAFRGVGNGLFGSDQGSRVVHFEAFRQTQGFASIDSRIILGNRDLIDATGKAPACLLGIDPRSIGWTPTALTLALIAATPIPWQRRLWGMVVGFVLIQVFIAATVWVYIWNESTNISLITLSPFWKPVADALQYTLVTQMGISFTVPVLIWIAVVFRRDDVRPIIRQTANI